MNGTIDINLGSKPTLTTAIHNYTASGGTTANVDLSNYYNKAETDVKLNTKVDTVEGKGLSTNDYTTEEKTKLQGLSNYDSTIKQSITDEATRAIAAEVQLQKNIDEKSIDLSDYDLSLQLSKYETSSAHTADVTELQTAIDSKLNKSDYMSKDLSNYYDKSETDSKLLTKIDVAEGKGLSTNDYTTEEKTKLNSLNNYDDSEVKNSINNETARATSVESQLQQNIDNKTVDLSNYVLSSELTKYETSSAHTTDITVLNSAIDSKLDKSDYAPVDLSPYYNKVDIDAKLNGKVDTIEGKQLSTNDYSNIEKNKLNSISNYDDSTINNSINNEVARAEAAESQLQQNIDNKQAKGDYVSASQLNNYETTTAHSTDIQTLQSAIDSKLNKSDYAPVDLSNYYQKNQTSGATEIATAIAAISTISTTKVLTQAEYDAITSKDNNTTYIITA